MVHHITSVFKEYQDKLREIPYVPKISFELDSFVYCSDAKKTFLAFLFSDQATGIQFLEDVGITLSSIRTPEIILIPSSLRGVTLSLFFDHTTGGRTINSIWPLHVRDEVQGTRGASLHSIPCHRCIHRLGLLHSTRHVQVRCHGKSTR